MYGVGKYAWEVGMVWSGMVGKRFHFRINIHM